RADQTFGRERFETLSNLVSRRLRKVVRVPDQAWDVSRPYPTGAELQDQHRRVVEVVDAIAGGLVDDVPVRHGIDLDVRRPARLGFPVHPPELSRTGCALVNHDGPATRRRRARIVGMAHRRPLILFYRARRGFTAREVPEGEFHGCEFTMDAARWPEA